MLKSLVILVMCFLLDASSSFASMSSVDIIGGNVVNASQIIAKRTVGLYLLVKTPNGQSGSGLCTGSILDASHILTAAHCITGYQGGVVVFSTEMSELIQQASTQGIESTQGKVARMTGAVAMPGFPSGNPNGASEFVDLAVVSFTGGLPTGYEAAHFLSQNELFLNLTPSQGVTLAGYGRTSSPNIQKPVFSNALSDSGMPNGVGTLRDVQVAFGGFFPQKIDILVGGSQGHIACSGDSGGPAMIDLNGDTYVIGVASRSDCQMASIYTLVSKETLATAIKSLH